MSASVRSGGITAIAALLGLGSLSLLGSAPAHAAGWGFTPTPREWETWPQYCRVQYSYINRGANEYGDYYPDSAIAMWRDRIGEKTFIALHHYCAAMLYLRRLKLETHADVKANLLTRVLDDGAYTYERADPKSIIYPSIAAVMAQAKYVNGQPDEAIAILQRAIEQQPDRFEAYGELANIYREQHKLDKAIEVVQQANTASGGDSPEIQYTLGLLNIEAGNVDAAVENAKRAYAQDYPLPGLRTKLIKLGKWPPHKNQ